LEAPGDSGIKRDFMDKIRFLNGNLLKIVGLITMTIDHIGFFLFPGVLWFRIVGRIAFPIFAYMIAQGCLHTRSPIRYFMSVFGLGLGCQIALYFVAKTLYMGILISFSFSIAMIFCLKRVILDKQSPIIKRIAYAVGFVVLLSFACVVDLLLKGIDYGYFGCLLPVGAFLPNLLPDKVSENKKHLLSIFLMAVFMAPIALNAGIRYGFQIQWFSYLALIPLLSYSGKRGKINLKYLFYIYYPAHLATIFLIRAVGQ
jgi:hypothetical protein